MTGHRSRVWVGGLALLIVAVAEFVRSGAPAWAWAGTSVAAAAAAAAALAARRPGHRVLAVLLLALGASLGLAGLQLRRVAQDWPAERESRVAAAGERLARDLHGAFRLAERLADAGRQAAELEREAAFRALAQAVARGEFEAGLAILDGDGTPWAWAGTHRVPVVAAGDSIAAALTRYAVALESRRHAPRGRVVVAQAVLWTHPAVPERDRTLGERFRAATGIALEFFAPERAPDHPDVFDYCEPTTEGPRCLFSARPLPPSQDAAFLAARARAARTVTAVALVALLATLLAGGDAFTRGSALPLALWLLLRAPAGDVLGLGALFSPATFFVETFGWASSSAAALGLTAGLATVGAALLWGRVPWHPAGSVVALGLLGIVPYLVGFLRRGITPPTGGVTPELWMSWQLALLLAASAPIVLAAALRRGREPVAGGAGWVRTGILMVVATTILGLSSWDPAAGWPDWYPFLWVPALWLATRPAPRGWALGGMAVVAGSLAALVTWGAEVRGRLDMAQREIGRLGSSADPVAVRLLERFAEAAHAAPAPRTGTELYALWRGSVLSDRGYPARLAVWTPDAGWIAELPLDSLPLPAGALADAAGAARGAPAVRSVPATPGLHHVLAAPLSGDTVLVVAIGPPTQLIAPSRLGRLLEAPAREGAPYRLTLASPVGRTAPEGRLAWRREGWVITGERLLETAGPARLVYAQLDLRGPVPLLVRGAVALAADVAVLLLLWLLADLVRGERPPLPAWRRLARSFRARLALTLAAFFILPVVAFSTWGLLRLADDGRRGSDAVLRKTLEDAVESTVLPPTGADGELVLALDSLGRRLDEHLGYYRGGRLEYVSDGILRDLGVLGAFMDPSAYRALVFGGQVEALRNGPMPSLGERVGYRIVRPDRPSQLGVLAAARRADDPAAAVPRRDIAFVLLLLLLVGIGAAVVGAGAASRALSRPVAALRRAALALGEGQPAPPAVVEPPAEFAPVFGAFERMAADVRSSQAALERARRRTEAVLATVATGVVALDPDGTVRLANREAEELLGAPLPPGAAFAPAAAARCPELADAVARALAGAPARGMLEFTAVDGRRLSVRTATLAQEASGLVLALADVTELSRAERVLAWGEMARQVAHEIKNPLTPMRLGVQHLRRAWRDGRADYDAILEETAERVLGEIDRLDGIARAFSRFAAPGTTAQPLDRLPLRSTCDDVLRLYALAESGTRVTLDAPAEVEAPARKDELKEVLVNLIENARDAGASEIVVALAPGRLAVRDDGRGIPPEHQPRVFEPHFSTTTSGSGLGLSIVRRLVESWGARIALESRPGAGTTVTIRWPGEGA